MSKPTKPSPRVMTVKEAFYLTPHMIRVVLTGPGFLEDRIGCDGANCKIFIPKAGQSRPDFEQELAEGRPTVRTYTVRSYRYDVGELDIDFVAHGDEGPASAWAMRAKPGDFLGLRGPSEPKVDEYYADWYLLAADMSALPVVSATLETMPADAKGVAIFEVQSEEDRQNLVAPPGIKQHWLVQPDPHKASAAQETMIRELDWPDGVVQTCIAGESGVIKALRGFLHREKQLPRKDVYISGYWKIGLIEDEHQKVKRAEAEVF